MAANARGFNVYVVVASCSLAVLLFVVGRTFPSIEHALRAAGYVGTFALGHLYVYSFTKLSAAALLFLMSRSQNLWLAGTVATFGAVLADFTVFMLFRSAKGFAERLPSKERYAAWWAVIEGKIPRTWQPFVVMAVASVFILLPLPNEFADYLLARTRRVKPIAVLLMSCVLNGLSIYAIMWLARVG